MNPNIYNHVKETARIAIQNGHTITIDRNLPSIAIEVNFDDYFFQGHEAEELLAQTEKSSLREFCSAEQILLWKAQSW